MESLRSKNAFEKFANTGVSVTLPTQIKADLKKIRAKLITAGLLDNKGRPIAKKQLIIAEDADIIRYYSSLAHGLLSYYRCSDNLNKIKDLVMYEIRFSLAATLTSKHKMNKAKFMIKYGEPITCVDFRGAKVSFLNNMQVYNLRKEFLANVKANPFKDIEKIIVKVANSVINQGSCAVEGCPNTNIEIHHIKQLFKRSKAGESFQVISAGRSKKISGVMALESALRRKQIPLCKTHHLA